MFRQLEFTAKRDRGGLTASPLWDRCEFVKVYNMMIGHGTIRCELSAKP